MDTVGEGLAEFISGSSYYQATYNGGGQISITTAAKGPYTGYTLSTSVSNDCDPASDCGRAPVVTHSLITAGHYEEHMIRARNSRGRNTAAALLLAICLLAPGFVVPQGPAKSASVPAPPGARSGPASASTAPTHAQPDPHRRRKIWITTAVIGAVIATVYLAEHLHKHHCNLPLEAPGGPPCY